MHGHTHVWAHILLSFLTESRGNPTDRAPVGLLAGAASSRQKVTFVADTLSPSESWSRPLLTFSEKHHCPDRGCGWRRRGTRRAHSGGSRSWWHRCSGCQTSCGSPWGREGYPGCRRSSPPGNATSLTWHSPTPTHPLCPHWPPTEGFLRTAKVVMSGNPTITLILMWTLPNKISQTHLWLGRLGIQKHDCWAFCKLRGARQQGCCSVLADTDLLGRWQVAKKKLSKGFPWQWAWEYLREKVPESPRLQKWHYSFLRGPCVLPTFTQLQPESHRGSWQKRKFPAPGRELFEECSGGGKITTGCLKLCAEVGSGAEEVSRLTMTILLWSEHFSLHSRAQFPSCGPWACLPRFVGSAYFSKWRVSRAHRFVKGAHDLQKVYEPAF